MPRRRFTRSRSGPKRKMDWHWAGLYMTPDTIDENDVIATWARVPAGYVDNANSAGIPVQIAPDATLIRSRVIATCSTNNGGAQSTYPFTVSFGLIAWDGTSDDTADIGIIPHPYYDQDLDWIWRQDYASNVLNTFSNPPADLDGYQSKAMRKLSTGTGLLMCAALADPIGFQGAVIIGLNMNFRGLFKLP